MRNIINMGMGTGIEKKELTELSGTVESVIFSNEDTGFTVLELDTNGELVSVVGEMMGIAAGEKVVLHGIYKTHPSYGTQFKVSAYERKMPSSATAIEKYLASGVVKGIGPSLASRIVRTFHEKTLQIMEKEPDRLTEVPGISPSKCAKITEEFNRMFGIRTTLLFLSQFGIDSSTAISIWKRWGNNAKDMIEENPYLLCAEGIELDFYKCDIIGQKLEIPLDSGDRIAAALLYVLRHNLQNGHTCLPYDKLLPNVSELIGQNQIMVEKELDALEERQEISLLEVNGRIYCYLPEYLEAEEFIASKIEFMLIAGPGVQQNNLPADNIALKEVKKVEEVKEVEEVKKIKKVKKSDIKYKNYSSQIAKLEETNSIIYADLQKEAIEQAMNSSIFILTGGPGTGKTTTINAILALFDEQEQKVALCAPTGRAAKRMSEVTGREAKTIHRLLEVDFAQTSRLHFKRNEKNPLQSDVIIVDEVSMVDVPLMQSLVCAIKMSCRLILVGDSDQLPSVGPGNVLKDLIESERIPSVRLTEIFRQAQKSLIVTNAHAIVQGKVPDLTKHDNDFFFLKRSTYEQVQATVLELCATRLPKSYGYSPMNDIQIITPTRIGPVGANNLNIALQEVLNPPEPKKQEFTFNGKILRVGDKIMQVQNNYDIIWTREKGEDGIGVYNGDIGIIEEIDRPGKTIIIRYDDKLASYFFEMADQIELAYAITVHKSQGSEFEAVIMPLMSYKSKMHYRNLLYTAVTRARSKLIILGQEKTIAEMVANNRRTIRYTNLLEILRGEC